MSKMFICNNDFYGNRHFPTGMPSGDGVLQSNGHLNSNMHCMFTEPGQTSVTQKWVNVNCYPESVTSCGSDEYDDNSFQMQLPHLGSRCLNNGVQQASSYQWDMAATSENHLYQRHSCQVTSDEQPMGRTAYGYPCSMAVSSGVVPYLDDRWNVHASSCCYDKASRDNESNFHHSGRRSHLSKMMFGNRRKKLKYRSSEGAGEKKKRYRPFAAIRERERLAVMNTALKELKTCLPVEDHKKKLSKKQILISAAIYIKSLSETLDCQRETSSVGKESVNLDKHDYILGSE